MSSEQQQQQQPKTFSFVFDPFRSSVLKPLSFPACHYFSIALLLGCFTMMIAVEFLAPASSNTWHVFNVNSQTFTSNQVPFQADILTKARASNLYSWNPPADRSKLYARVAVAFGDNSDFVQAIGSNNGTVSCLSFIQNCEAWINMTQLNSTVQVYPQFTNYTQVFMTNLVASTDVSTGDTADPQPAYSAFVLPNHVYTFKLKSTFVFTSAQSYQQSLRVVLESDLDCSNPKVQNSLPVCSSLSSYLTFPESSGDSVAMIQLQPDQEVNLGVSTNVTFITFVSGVVALTLAAFHVLQLLVSISTSLVNKFPVGAAKFEKLMTESAISTAISIFFSLALGIVGILYMVYSQKADTLVIGPLLLVNGIQAKKIVTWGGFFIPFCVLVMFACVGIVDGVVFLTSPGQTMKKQYVCMITYFVLLLVFMWFISFKAFKVLTPEQKQEAAAAAAASGGKQQQEDLQAALLTAEESVRPVSVK